MAYRIEPSGETVKSAGRRFRAALKSCVWLLAVLWALVMINGLPGIELRGWGVHPRELQGLVGLITMPLLHSGIPHMANNTLPLLMLGVGLLWFYPHTARKVVPWFWVLPGLFVWLIGRDDTVHIGLSGFNFALLGYVSLGGFLRRDAGTLSLSIAVLFYYGGMFSGILPIQPGISWEGHLGGLITGFAFAWIYRDTDIPVRKRYSWEDEEEDDEAGEAEFGSQWWKDDGGAEHQDDQSPRPPTLH